jgi:lauroyl/myristoyl acyltransferase
MKSTLFESPSRMNVYWKVWFALVAVGLVLLTPFPYSLAVGPIVNARQAEVSAREE